jgi:tRNA (cmo5U34)-methyltransferase
MKSTVDEIRTRFDGDVERFANLDTGQVAAIDSPLHMDLLTEAAAVTTPYAQHVLDIGCGAGNYALKLLQRLGNLEVTLVDLSQPMLDRAAQRVGEVTDAPVHTVQSDVREAGLGEQRYDIVVAAQCLHHLRAEAEWHDVFGRIFQSIRPGGSF